MTPLLACAVCGRDWTHGPDNTGDPMVSWLTDDAAEPVVRAFGLVCQGACSRAWQKHRPRSALFDAHLSWWVGPACALDQLARVLDTYRWPAALSRRVVHFAVAAAGLSPKRRRAK